MNKKRFLIWSFFLGILLFIVTGCSSSSEKKPTTDTATEATTKKQLAVVTTFYPMYEFTRQVAGDLANVTLMVPAGTDTHHYEPSAKDLATISGADLFIYNSPAMEIWVPDVLKALGEEDMTIVQAAEGIDMIEESDEEEDDEEISEQGDAHAHGEDPHVWLDPVLAQREIQTIKEAFIQKDPKNQSTYEQNASRYIDQLNALHNDYQTAFTGAKNRIFITQHAAFGYLAARYNLTQLSIAGFSTENEPSPAQIAKITQLIYKHDIPVIYRNSDAAQGSSDALAQEAGVKVETLNALESMTEKEMEEGEDYLSVMRKNLDALKQSIR